jgi:hypothetical protein
MQKLAVTFIIMTDADAGSVLDAAELAIGDVLACIEAQGDDAVHSTSGGRSPCVTPIDAKRLREGTAVVSL